MLMKKIVINESIRPRKRRNVQNAIDYITFFYNQKMPVYTYNSEVKNFSKYS